MFWKVWRVIVMLMPAALCVIRTIQGDYDAAALYFLLFGFLGYILIIPRFKEEDSQLVKVAVQKNRIDN